MKIIHDYIRSRINSVIFVIIWFDNCSIQSTYYFMIEG